MNKARVKRYGLILLAIGAMGLSQMACDDTDTDNVTVGNVAEKVEATSDGIDVIVDGFDAVHAVVCTDNDTRAMCNGGEGDAENPGLGGLLKSAIEITENVTGYDSE